MQVLYSMPGLVLLEKDRKKAADGNDFAYEETSGHEDKRSSVRVILRRTKTSHKQWVTTALPKVSNSIPVVPLASELHLKMSNVTSTKSHHVGATKGIDFYCQICNNLMLT